MGAIPVLQSLARNPWFLLRLLHLLFWSVLCFVHSIIHGLIPACPYGLAHCSVDSCRHLLMRSFVYAFSSETWAVAQGCLHCWQVNPLQASLFRGSEFTRQPE